jgi:RES domain-containing protein
MRLWRISHRNFALDRTCAGAALYGGRWNPVGTPALYCGTSIALCALEKFVHVGTAPLPPLVLVAVDLPDDAATLAPALDALPPGWDAMPTSAGAQAFGRAWLDAGDALALRVPSAILPEESNVIVNPRHPAYARVDMTVIRPFSFDGRMFKT